MFVRFGTASANLSSREVFGCNIDFIATAIEINIARLTFGFAGMNHRLFARSYILGRHSWTVNVVAAEKLCSHGACSRRNSCDKSMPLTMHIEAIQSNRRNISMPSNEYCGNLAIALPAQCDVSGTFLHVEALVADVVERFFSLTNSRVGLLWILCICMTSLWLSPSVDLSRSRIFWCSKKARPR